MKVITFSEKFGTDWIDYLSSRMEERDFPTREEYRTATRSALRTILQDNYNVIHYTTRPDFSFDYLYFERKKPVENLLYYRLKRSAQATEIRLYRFFERFTYSFIEITKEHIYLRGINTHFVSKSTYFSSNLDDMSGEIEFRLYPDDYKAQIVKSNIFCHGDFDLEKGEYLSYKSLWEFFLYSFLLTYDQSAILVPHADYIKELEKIARRNSEHRVRSSSKKLEEIYIQVTDIFYETLYPQDTSTG